MLVARARAGAGMASVNVSGTLHASSLDLLEGALLASEAAQALFQMEGGWGFWGVGWVEGAAVLPALSCCSPHLHSRRAFEWKVRA